MYSLGDKYQKCKVAVFKRMFVELQKTFFNRSFLLLRDFLDVLFLIIFSRGQLGLGHVETREQPCLVEDLTGVRMKCVGAGGWHSMAISGTYWYYREITINHAIKAAYFLCN